MIPSDVKTEAMRLYNLLKEKGIQRGIKMEIIFTACLIAAARKLGKSISLDEISNEVGVSVSQLKQYRKLINRILLKISQIEPIYINVNYYYSLLDMFSLPQEVREELIKLINDNIQFFVGKNPRGMIGAMVYLVAKKHGLPLTQKTIAEKLNVSEVTIRNRIRELTKNGVKGWKASAESNGVG